MPRVAPPARTAAFALQDSCGACCANRRRWLVGGGKDRQTALDWLERAVEGGYREYAQIALDPILAELRSEARYRQAIDRMRRDVDAQRARAAERGLLDLTSLYEPAR